jgi:uncharacterized repeat protein (TIGR01451 family)
MPTNYRYSILVAIFFFVGLFSQAQQAYATDYPSCPFTPQAGRTVVNFPVGSAGDFTYEFIERIVSDTVNYPAYTFRSPSISAAINAGSYNVSLFSADAGIDRASLVPEPNERIFLILNNGLIEVARTNSTDDLPDGVNSIGIEKLVNTNLVLAQNVDSVVSYHSNYPDTTSANSVVTICAAFDLQASAPTSATINVVKTVINDNGGTKVIADFPLFVNGMLVVSGATNIFPAPASYVVSETVDSNYTQTFSGDCDINGNVNLTPGENKFCIITNNDIAAILPGAASGGGNTGLGLTPPPVPPLIDVVKVPSPLALPAGPGPVIYTYTLRNIGTVPVVNVTMMGDSCSPVVLVSGDTNFNLILEVNETWIYGCTTTLSSTHTNTITATGWANGISAVDIASATVIVGLPVVPPLIHVTKIPNPLALSIGGGIVTYTNVVTNPGIVPLSNVRLADDKCSPVNFISGDTDNDSMLDNNEAWVYTCRTNLAQTTTNTIVASGEASGFLVRDFAIATVVVSVPRFPDMGVVIPLLPDTGFPFKENNTLLAVALVVGVVFVSYIIYKKRIV